MKSPINGAVLLKLVDRVNYHHLKSFAKDEFLPVSFVHFKQRILDSVSTLSVLGSNIIVGGNIAEII